MIFLDPKLHSTYVLEQFIIYAKLHSKSFDYLY